MELRAETSVFNDGKLNADISDAQNAAEQAYEFAYNVDQHFWFNQSGSDTGAHIAFVPKSTFEEEHDGYNLLLAADAIAIRNGLLPTMVLDNDSLDFNIVDTTNGTYTNVASFGEITTIGNTNAQNVLINSSGISMRYGLLPSMIIDEDSLDFNTIDINNNTYVNIATFGLNTRIGRNNIGYSNLLLSPELFTFVSVESTNVFSTGTASNEIATSAVIINVDWGSSITTGLQLGSYTLAPNASTTVGGTFYSSVLANLDSGTRFSFSVEVYINDASFTSEIFSCTLYGTNGFTKGTSQTLTNFGYHGLNTALYYDGIGTLTLSGTIRNYSQVTWNISTNEVVSGITEPINTNVYNTSIGGNTFLNASNGSVYVGLSNKNAERTSDYNLYQAIHALGWDNDVIVGITLSQHTKTIQNSGMLIDNIIDFTMCPLTATVTITSSDTSVISGGDVDYYDNNLYFIALDIVSNGTATVTASITIGEQTYSDSCVVTVTS